MLLLVWSVNQFDVKIWYSFIWFDIYIYVCVHNFLLLQGLHNASWFHVFRRLVRLTIYLYGMIEWYIPICQGISIKL